MATLMKGSRILACAMQCWNCELTKLCPVLTARPQPLAHALKFTSISAVEEQVKGVPKVYFETQENQSRKVRSCDSLCASIGVITLSDNSQLPLSAFLLRIQMFWVVMPCQQFCVSDMSEECSVFKR
jgi:hypothetical protein